MFKATGGTFVNGGTQTTVTSDSNGQASVMFTPTQTGTLTIRAGRDPNDNGDLTDDGSLNTTTFSVSVSDDGTSGSSLYTLQWDTDAIEQADGIDSCSGNTCTYELDHHNHHQEIDPTLTVNTTPSIESVNVDFATNDSNIVDFEGRNSEDETDNNGEATVDTRIDTQGTAEIYASSAGSSDKLILTSKQSTGTTTLNAKNAHSSGPSNSDSGVRFTLENTGTSGIEITAISVDSTDSDADRVVERSWGDGRYAHEAFVNVNGNPDHQDSGDGYADGDISIDGDKLDMDERADLDSSDSAEVYLYEFRDVRDSVDMKHHSVTVTIYYDVVGGGSGSYTTPSLDVS